MLGPRSEGHVRPPIEGASVPLLPGRPSIHRRHAVLLGVIIVVAAALRLAHVGAPPTDFHATRQYNDVLLAHSFFVDLRHDVPQRERDIARINRPEVLEPPLLEGAAALFDQAIGHESLLFPRLVSIAAWLLAGLLLWGIATRLATVRAALAAVGILELLPFAVVASRSFQPDPLAVTSMLLAVLCSLRWAERESASRLVVAGAAAGVAITIKADFAPFVFAGHAATVWTSRAGGAIDRLRSLLRPRQALFAVAAVLPAIAWTIFGFRASLSVTDKAGEYFIPRFLAMSGFWSGMADQLRGVFGLPVILAAAGGVVLARNRARAMLWSFVVAYVGFAVAFDYRVATHSYYQLPAIPFVALAAGITVDRVATWVDGLGLRPVIVTALGASGMLLVVAAVLTQDRPPPTSGGRAEIAKAHILGSALCHPLHSVFVSPAYGLPLAYHGGIGGTYWPSPADLSYQALKGRAQPSAVDRLAAFRTGGSRYVIATELGLLGAQPDLAAALAPYPMVIKSPGFGVWDLRPGAPPSCAGGPS